VVGAISPKLEQAEIERTKHKPTENLDAYDYYLRGLAGLHLWTREGNEEALSSFYHAIELDPSFATAYGMASHCYDQRKENGWMADRAGEVAETARLVRRASELGNDDAVALCNAGIALAYVVGDLDGGGALIDRALLLNTNLAAAWQASGWIRVYLSDFEAAIERIGRAMRLTPHDPDIVDMQTGTAVAHFLAGRYTEALAWAEMAVRQQPNFCPAIRALAASSAMAGRQDQARKAIATLRELDPDLRVSRLRDLFPIRRPEDFARWEEGIRRAGLPE
jgi:tetratricopeptide (TPR) repeat protein